MCACVFFRTPPSLPRIKSNRILNYAITGRIYSTTRRTGLHIKSQHCGRVVDNRIKRNEWNENFSWTFNEYLNRKNLPFAFVRWSNASNGFHEKTIRKENLGIHWNLYCYVHGNYYHASTFIQMFTMSRYGENRGKKIAHPTILHWIFHLFPVVGNGKGFRNKLKTITINQIERKRKKRKKANETKPPRIKHFIPNILTHIVDFSFFFTFGSWPHRDYFIPFSLHLNLGLLPPGPAWLSWDPYCLNNWFNTCTYIMRKHNNAV